MTDTKFLNLFIIGPSGCGKSTQAELIAKKYNLTHISTGEAFRREMSSISELGLKAKEYVDKGLWVPSPIVIKIVAQELAKVNNCNFIIDGTPRLPDQCGLIDEYLSDNNQTSTALIHLDVTFEEIYTRKNKMGDSFQDKNRTDESVESFKHRLAEYQKYNDVILGYYHKLGKLIRVDGNRPIEPIFEDIVKEIEKIK